jgi:hypothetical protein
MHVIPKAAAVVTALVFGHLTVGSLADESSAAQDDRDANSRRYEARDPSDLMVPRRPVTRKEYVDFVRPWAEDYEMTAESDQWGWRHGPLRIMPPLAVFALEGDADRKDFEIAK